jgi:repressor LexA
MGSATFHEERIDPNDLFAGPDVFLLQVRGTGMVADRIEDGDYLVIRKRESLQTGDRVVASVRGSRGVASHGIAHAVRFADRIELRTADGRQIVRYVREGDTRVEGVLIGVIRKYRD